LNISSPSTLKKPELNPPTNGTQGWSKELCTTLWLPAPKRKTTLEPRLAATLACAKSRSVPPTVTVIVVGDAAAEAEEGAGVVAAKVEVMGDGEVVEASVGEMKRSHDVNVSSELMKLTLC
jgi:hypothetical protein